MNCQFGPSYLLRRVTSCVKTVKAKFDGNYNFEKKKWLFGNMETGF